MQIVYCRLETSDNQIRDFSFENHTKLDKGDYDLVYKAYLYLIYYFSTVNEMSDKDLDFYGLYAPPFLKAVFILRYKDKFLKINYNDNPLTYQLSDFNPETRESVIISDKSREIYSLMVSEYGLKPWDEYKNIYSFFIPDDTTEAEEGFQVSSYGDDYEEENSLVLATSSVTYEELGEETAYSSKNFDKYPIKERRNMLEEYKEKLKTAIYVNDLKKSVNEIDKKISYYSSIKKRIDEFNEVIAEKEKGREKFKDIAWMSLNLYKQLNIYKIKKKKYEDSLESYNQKLEKNEKDLKNIDHDNIFKNKIFLPSFLMAVTTFILSWVLRQQFWYLAGASIVFFTVSFYYLWGYLDYIDYIIKLKREKNFYEKKIIKTQKDFKKEFGNLEAVLKHEKVDDIDVPIARFDELKEYDLNLEKIKEELQTYIAQKFSEDAQEKFENFKNERKILMEKLSQVKEKDLNVKEIEYDIIELKKSIKEYERQELDEFTLDDEPEEKTENKVQNKEFENKYALNELKNYIANLRKLSDMNLEELYLKIQGDFTDILEFSVNYEFSVKMDFDNDEYYFTVPESIDWDKKFDKRIKIFFQYAFIKYISSKEPLILFLDLMRLSSDYGVMFSTYLNELSDAQVIYA